MITLVAGSLVLSVLHAVIPNHWLPLVAVARREGWSMATTLRVTAIAGLSHAASTVLIGLSLALVGAGLAARIENFTLFISPTILVGLGLFYIYQHSRHHHFHLHGHPEQVSRNKLIFSLATAMFLSPCFEIEPYFLAAGAEGPLVVFLLAGLYTIVTVSGMVAWVRLAYRGVLTMDWHLLEHNAGIITGVTLVLSGIFAYFLNRGF